MTELTPTLKISATSRRDAPLSTASSARSRKSVEYGFGIDLAPQANQFLQTRLGKSTWESPRFNAAGKCSSCRTEVDHGFYSLFFVGLFHVIPSCGNAPGLELVRMA
jgi:hypothetical protein